MQDQQEKDKRKGPWTEQIARDLPWEDSFLKGKRYLIHDRDLLYTAEFQSILKTSGIDPVKRPPRSHHLNAYAERFVRSIKQECLSKRIRSPEEQLRYVLSQHLDHYHHERIHQGINGILKPPHEGHQGDIFCIERLGGWLRSYHRKAA